MDTAEPAWRTCLDVERQDAGHYLEYWNEGLMGLLERAPARVLELGCATGAFGAALKARHPAAYVVGVEASLAASEQARGRLDHVVCARLEALDFAAAPGGGRFDLAVAADILEHLANPWSLLVRLKSCLAPGAQLLASIPNVRNLALIASLLDEGRWRYRERGLLDVTHLRVVAFEDMRSAFEETGYAVESVSMNISPPLAELYHRHRDAAASTIRLGRLTLDGVTPRELAELCAEQFLLRCRVL